MAEAAARVRVRAARPPARAGVRRVRQPGADWPLAAERQGDRHGHQVRISLSLSHSLFISIYLALLFYLENQHHNWS